LRGITAAPAVLAEQQVTTREVGLPPIGRRCSKHLDGMADRIDSEEAKARQAAEPMGAAVPVPSASGSLDRQPAFVSRSQPIDPRCSFEAGEDRNGEQNLLSQEPLWPRVEDSGQGCVFSNAG
jgi:hypothetical protein